MASPTTAALASESVARLLDTLAQQADVTAKTPGLENVHDLRVAVRRFTQALLTFRGVIPRRDARRVRRKLKVLKNRAGAVRDNDMACKTLGKCHAPGAPALLRKLAARRRGSAADLTAAIREWQELEPPERLRAL